MLLNKPSVPTSTIFKYIVKEKSKNVILIADSDEELDPSTSTSSSLSLTTTTTTSAALPTPPTQPTLSSKKRKRSKLLPVHGNLHDPIALDDSDDEITTVEEKKPTLESMTAHVNNDTTTRENTPDIVVEEEEEEKYTTPEADIPFEEPMMKVEPVDMTHGEYDDNAFMADIEEEEQDYGGMDIDIGDDMDLVNATTLFSPLSEYATMSESELSFARERTVEDTEMQEVLPVKSLPPPPPPPTTVDTIKTDDNAALLRYLELYIQSVSDTPSMPVLEARTSRRSRANNNTTSTHMTNDKIILNPYVPNRVWYNSTWEDWAQLDANDVLHVPFTQEESLIIETQVAKYAVKKTNNSNSTTTSSTTTTTHYRHYSKDLADFWQYVSTLLPGRTPLDCRCFYQDFIDCGGGGNYNKSIMIGRYKQPLRNHSRHQLVSKRSQSGFLNYSAVKKIHLANMSRESIIAEGSGDAISLAIFGDQVNGIRVAVGSLCDENTQYNMPGNLRLWTSDNENCLSLRGHKTPNEENGQDIWRTVTDVKLSKDQSLIYSASHDGCANVWRASTGKLVSTLQYHCKPINQLAVSYSAVENNVLATCSNDGTATIWSVSPNGKTGSGMICELDTNFYSDPCVDCIDFGHGASEDMLFLGINNQDMDHPGYIDVFDATKGASKVRFDSMMGCVSALAVSTSGRFVVSGNYNRYDNMAGDRFLHLHDIRLTNSVTKFFTGHPDVNIVAISPCERYVASGNADKEKGEVLVFDVRSGRKVLHKLSHDQTLVNQSLIAPDSSIGIGGLYWTSDSRTILTGGGDSTVKVWGVEGATRLLKSYPTSNCVTSLTVHEESMTIAAGVAGAQGIVHVWRP